MRIRKKYTVWLYNLNQKFFRNEPLIWINNYPLLIGQQLPLIVLGLIGCSIYYYFDPVTISLLPFALLLVYMFAFLFASTGHFFVRENNERIFLKNIGLFTASKQKQVLKWNLYFSLIVLFPFLIYSCIVFFTYTPISPKDFNDDNINTIILADYYFEDGDTKNLDIQTIKPLVDSFLIKLDTSRFHRYPIEKVVSLIQTPQKPDSIEIFEKYCELLKLDDADTHLNQLKSAIKYPDKYVKPSQSFSSFKKGYSEILTIINKSSLKEEDKIHLPSVYIFILIIFMMSCNFGYFGRDTFLLNAWVDVNQLEKIEKVLPGVFLGSIIVLVVLFIPLISERFSNTFLNNLSDFITPIQKVLIFIISFLFKAFLIAILPLFLYDYFINYPKRKYKLLSRSVKPEKIILDSTEHEV